jgi:hypothetical protein
MNVGACHVFSKCPTLEVSGGGRTTRDFRLGHRTATRRCPPVRLSELILIEAPSSAYRRGMLALGKQQPKEEETS